MKICFLLCVLLGCLVCRAQEVRWLTLPEAGELFRENPRPYLFYIGNDDEEWCRQMDKTTYRDEVIVSFVNRYFYPVRLDVWATDTVRFQDKIYPPVLQNNRWVNGLALELTKGNLFSPTTVFLLEHGKTDIVVPGYIDILKMQGFMVYFSENVYESTNIQDFLSDFNEAFGQKTVPAGRPADWINFEELELNRNRQKKKILLFLEASWSNSSKLMERLVFRDSTIVALAREHFYCLRLDVQSPDTLTFMSHKFGNAGAGGNHLHQLAIALNEKILKVPGVYIFDEEGKLLERLFYYLDRRRGQFILDYIGTDLFKTMSWTDYLRLKQREIL